MLCNNNVIDLGRIAHTHTSAHTHTHTVSEVTTRRAGLPSMPSALSLLQTASREAAPVPSDEAPLSLLAGGDIFLTLSPRLPRPRLRRPIMLYQIPWPFERSRRWTRYTPPLNVNNLSLTSTSECAVAATDAYISVSRHPHTPPHPHLLN